MRKFLAAAAIAAAGVTASWQAGANCTAADFPGHYVGVGNGAAAGGFHQALYCEVNIKTRGKFVEFGGGSVCSILPGNVAHRVQSTPIEIFPDCRLTYGGTITLVGSSDTILIGKATGDKSHAVDTVDHIVIVGHYPNRQQSDFEITLTRTH